MLEDNKRAEENLQEEGRLKVIKSDLLRMKAHSDISKKNIHTINEHMS